MVIGLVIGGIIWAFFTCLSRRRASAHISQGSPSSFSRRSRPSSHGHAASRTGFYRNSSCERRSNLSLASLTFQRQASLEQANSFPRKSSFRASTFHPFLQCPPLPVETNSQLITLTPTNTTTTLVGSTTNSLSRPEFHWSNNNLRICHSTQTPPPAYETIIKAFPESWASSLLQTHMCILGGTAIISTIFCAWWRSLRSLQLQLQRGHTFCWEACSSDFMEPSIPLSERSLVFALLTFIYCSAVCLQIYSVVSLIAAIVSLF